MIPHSLKNFYSLRNGFDLIEHQGLVSAKAQLLGPIHTSMVIDLSLSLSLSLLLSLLLLLGNSYYINV